MPRAAGGRSGPARLGPDYRGGLLRELGAGRERRLQFPEAHPGPRSRRRIAQRRSLVYLSAAARFEEEGEATEATSVFCSNWRLTASFNSSTRNGLARNGKPRVSKNSIVRVASVSPVTKMMRACMGLPERTSAS